MGLRFMHKWSRGLLIHALVKAVILNLCVLAMVSRLCEMEL